MKKLKLLLFLIIFIIISWVVSPAAALSDCCRCCEYKRRTTPLPPMIPALKEWEGRTRKEIEFLNYKYKKMEPYLQAWKYKTAMYYNGTLYCNRKEFCAVIYYHEWQFFADDYLQYADLHCTRTGVLRHTANMFFTSPDRGDMFDPQITVYTDCNEKNRIYVRYKVLPDIPTHLKMSFNEYHFNLSTYSDQRWIHPKYDMYHDLFGLTIDQSTTDFLWDRKDMTKDPKYEYLYKQPLTVERYLIHTNWKIVNGRRQKHYRDCRQSSHRKKLMCYT